MPGYISPLTTRSRQARSVPCIGLRCCWQTNEIDMPSCLVAAFMIAVEDLDHVDICCTVLVDHAAPAAASARSTGRGCRRLFLQRHTTCFWQNPPHPTTQRTGGAIAIARDALALRLPPLWIGSTFVDWLPSYLYHPCLRRLLLPTGTCKCGQWSTESCSASFFRFTWGWGCSVVVVGCLLVVCSCRLLLA